MFAHELTEEQKAIRNEARKFFMEVYRPVSMVLDKMSPEDMIAKSSPVWDVMRQTRKLGYHKAGFPEALSGMAPVDPLSSILLTEERGYAAIDLSITATGNPIPFTYGLMSPHPEVQSLAKQFCDDTEANLIGCWAITEPEHGSDWLFWDAEHTSDPKCIPQVRAVKKGKEYVINGQKSNWVSMAGIASHALVFLGIEPSQGFVNLGAAIVPLDLPGVSRGKPLDKLGQRALDQTQLFFDDVRIPEQYMLISDPAIYKSVMYGQLTGGNAGLANFYVGAAQAALDEAIAYAKQRVQGGKPIVQHQSVRARLFDMFIRVEAALSLSRAVAMYNKRGTPSLQHSIASKNFCSEAAFQVASMAIQIFGGYGLTKDFVIEKIFRDTRAAMIEDGVNETLALQGAAILLAD
jgi:alkylation response protein AidB-like acyl-CoA dehydrogenase